MANKTEIKRFLERKSLECVDKLNHERDEKLKGSIQKFMEDNKDELASISYLITEFDIVLDKMISNIGASKTACINRDYYDGPIVMSNDLYKCFTSSKIGDNFKIVECEQIKTQYKQMIKDSRAEYVRLLAVTRSMDAKDGIALLERLGFDVSEIAVKKEVTALSTNIDIGKLFINYREEN